MFCPELVLLRTAAFSCHLSTITTSDWLATAILFIFKGVLSFQSAVILFPNYELLGNGVPCFLWDSIRNSRLDTSNNHVVPSFGSGCWYGWQSGSLLKGGPSHQQVGDADDYVNHYKIHRQWWLFVRICFVIEKLISYGPVSILR